MVDSKIFKEKVNKILDWFNKNNGYVNYINYKDDSNKTINAIAIRITTNSAGILIVNNTILEVHDLISKTTIEGNIEEIYLGNIWDNERWYINYMKPVIYNTIYTTEYGLSNLVKNLNNIWPIVDKFDTGWIMVSQEIIKPNEKENFNNLDKY